MQLELRFVMRVLQYEHGITSPWASAGIGKEGGGHLSPSGNVVKCFVTVKRSIDQLFKHYFHNFLEGRSDSFSSFGLCFEGND